MKGTRRVMGAFVAAAVLAGAGRAAEETLDPYAGESPAQRDARMKWWREARFGMFIHWGVYAVPAGTYQGRRIDGIGEWIMHRARIPVAEYRQFARQFNPVRYDPDAWVRLAKEAGMKYIVITSKHHDGFALFDSKVTEWDVVDATPYGKDLLKPLSEACARHGIRLGFYYSQAQDWNHPGGAAAGGHWDKAQDGDMDEYIRTIAVPQVREILTGYGPVAILWWDTPVDMNRQRADMLIPLLRLRPGIIHNNRLGGGYPGDTETPEQFIPPTGYPGGRDWETCMTMNDTWGYKSYDDNWKSTETLIRNLVDIASKGGNYLLNVGPTAEGLIPEPSVQRLREIGRWMRVHGEAIYATTASPFRRLPWGRCTKKAGPDATTLYLHVFDWPADGRLPVPGLKNRVLSVKMLADPGRELKHEVSDDGVVISVPTSPPDPICSVVVCRVEGPPDVAVMPLGPGADGSIVLPALDADLHGRTLRYESGRNRDNIGHWTDPEEYVEWPLRVERPGRYEVIVELASTGTGSFEVVAGAQRIRATAPNTGDYGKFTKVTIGTVDLPGGQVVRLQVRPVKEGWSPINLKSVRLSPAK